MKFLWLQLKIKTQYRTQADFAKAIGKSEEWISRVVNGRIKPNKDQREIIKAALKIDYDPLIEEIYPHKDQGSF